MSYNLELEKRIDRQTYQLGIDDKKKMFGGIGYLTGGKMVFGIHKEWLIVRTSPGQAEEWLKKEGVKVFDITGRPMKGWLMIAPESITTDNQLLVLLNLSKEFVRALPDK
jgi:TfoX/Sxy family transcriptional regulator of competence genes